MRCGLALRYRLAMLFICVAVAASAAVEKPDSLVRGLFLSLSDSQLGILPKTTRQDMLDYLDADSLATRPNAFRGDAYIVRSSKDFLEVRLSNVSTLQIKELPASKGVLLMTVYTIRGEGVPADSEVNFFDSSFRQLKREKILPLPDPAKFWNIGHLPKEERDRLRHEIDAIAFYSLAYTASPLDCNLNATVTLDDYLTQEQIKELEPYLDSRLQWLWDGKKFKLIHNS